MKVPQKHIVTRTKDGISVNLRITGNESLQSVIEDLEKIEDDILAYEDRTWEPKLGFPVSSNLRAKLDYHNHQAIENSYFKTTINAEVMA